MTSELFFSLSWSAALLLSIWKLAVVLIFDEADRYFEGRQREIDAAEARLTRMRESP